jgi:outer membrane protein
MQAELEASADVWIKYYDFRTAAQKLVFSESFLETSKNAYDLALESYKAGLRSILDLLDGESKLSDARSKLIQSKKDLFVALANLAHSTGSIGEKMETKNK